MKKAQMEIVGLLVIVILVVVIIFFSLTFRMRQPPQEALISFQDQRIAEILGPTIAETTVKCGTSNRLLRELIIDCAGTKGISCNQKTSCEKVNNTIQEMMKHTLDLDLDYTLTIREITDDTALVTNFSNIENTAGRSQRRYTTPLPSPIGSTSLVITVFY